MVAGNVDAQADVAAILVDNPHVLADNVVPRIGVLAPESARAAIREMFLAHVIGGKHLSARSDFTAMVRGATPDVVLTGVELLARGVGDVAVVDVGGATTDVHSVVDLDPDYRWAIVGSPDLKYLWILTRDKAFPKADQDALVARARALGYDTSRLVETPQR